jgi:hypothetical protein
MSWFMGLFVAAFLIGGVVLAATLLRLIAAWRDHRREQGPGSRPRD